MKLMQLEELIERKISGEWGKNPTGENDVKVIRTTNFTNEGILDIKDVVYRCIDKKKINSKRLFPGDIIIEKSGGSPKQPVGRVVYFDIDTNSEEVYLCNNFTAILRPDREKVMNKYLFYYLFYQYKVGMVLKYQNKTTGIINLKLDNYVKSLVLKLPPRKEQQKIIRCLDIVRKLIECRKQQITALTSLKQGLFLDMFGDLVKNRNGFKKIPLIDLCEQVLGGGTPSKKHPEYYNGDIPWVTPKDMKTQIIMDSIDHINQEGITNSSAKLIPNNSLLMVIRSGILKKKLPVSINKRDVTINQDMKAFILNEELTTPEYMLYFFINYQRVLLSQVRSVTADNLEFRQLKKLEVPIPSLEKQKKFTEKYYIVMKQIGILKQQLMQQELLFNSLTHKAFKGELFTDVPVST